MIHGDLSANHEIMSHEESYFWIAILLLIALFSLHYKYRPQLYVALAFIPFLLISLVANNRRADDVALIVGLMVAGCSFPGRPHASNSCSRFSLLHLFSAVFMSLLSITAREGLANLRARLSQYFTLTLPRLLLMPIAPSKTMICNIR